MYLILIRIHFTPFSQDRIYPNFKTLRIPLKILHYPSYFLIFVLGVWTSVQTRSLVFDVLGRIPKFLKARLQIPRIVYLTFRGDKALFLSSPSFWFNLDG